MNDPGPVWYGTQTASLQLRSGSVEDFSEVAGLSTPRAAMHIEGRRLQSRQGLMCGFASLGRARLLPSRIRQSARPLARGSAGASPSRAGLPQPQFQALTRHQSRLPHLSPRQNQLHRPVPIECIVPNPTILPMLPNSTNSTRTSSRLGLAVATLCGGTTLLLHPSVPSLLRALRDWGSMRANTIFGYGAHATAYLVMTFTVLAIATRYGRRAELWAIAILLIHGILTETAQLMIPQRSWDPLDLLANLVSVLVAGGVWRLARLHPTDTIG